MEKIFPQPSECPLSTNLSPWKRKDVIKLLVVFNDLLLQSMELDYPNREIVVTACAASFLIIQTKQTELDLMKKDIT